MKKKFGLAIVGGSGYGAGELLRLLSLHPTIEAACVVSRSHAGKSVASVHTHLQGITDLCFTDSLSYNWHTPYEGAAVVSGVPTGHAANTILEIIKDGLPSNVKIIDLSGDLRLRDTALHQKHYPEVPYSEALRLKAVYGLPELGTKEIREAQIITNPGCLATATILALAPLRGMKSLISVAVDAKTGTSGAGREPQPSMHHPGRALDCVAYKILEHRHEPEILQALGDDFAARENFMFVPHLLPISRGCLISCYLTFDNAANAKNAVDNYVQFYSGATFVRLRSRPARIVDVVGTNFCDLNIVARDKQVVITSTIDNLGKGMAGQCLQNLNLTFGFPEDTGLRIAALGPV
jgi:N-acetyl-gamma-glutamyl-phosphate reductase